MVKKKVKIDNEGELSDEAKKEIEEGRADARAGRVYTTNELLKSLGLKKK